jgi:hypothetical protein
MRPGRRPLRAALVTTMPQNSRAVTAAGITLAVSFGLLALVPLDPFRELAFVMAVGILLDAIVVRSLLVPSLLTLVGTASGWPGAHLRPDRKTTAGRRADGEPACEPAPNLEPVTVTETASGPSDRWANRPSGSSAPRPGTAPKDDGSTRVTVAAPVAVAAGVAALVSLLLWWRRTANRRGRGPFSPLFHDAQHGSVRSRRRRRLR